MTSGVTLSDGTNTVDFNTAGTKACNVTVSHRFSNPLLIVDTPIIATQTIGENAVPINIGFVTNAYDISFDLYDGPGTFNFKSPSTDYEKIMYMANYKKNVKTLTLNGTAFQGMIENVRIDWVAGKKNLSEGCTLTFHLTKDVPMG
jgi:hypothetical protein